MSGLSNTYFSAGDENLQLSDVEFDRNLILNMLFQPSQLAITDVYAMFDFSGDQSLKLEV
ncbi:MAG: hypothetical protein V9G98_08725 [Candidatus Competibacter sp.]